MPRRYYVEDGSEEFMRFAGWALATTTLGIAALIKNLTRANAYTPKAPDDPEQRAWYEGTSKVDITQAKFPKFGIPKISKLADLKNVTVEWKKEDRPQLVARNAGKPPFTYPNVVGEAKAYRIYPERGKAEPHASTELVAVLLSAAPRLSFEIVADGSSIYWQVCDDEGRYPEDIILKAIQRKHPTAKVEIAVRERETRQYPFYRQLVTFGLINEYAAPIPYYGDMKHDPLVSIVQHMDFLRPELEERLYYQLFTLTPTIEAQNRAGKRLLEGQVLPSVGIYSKDDPLAAFDQNLIDAKLDSPLYHCFLALTVESRDKSRLVELAQIANDLQRIKTTKHNGLTVVGSRELTHTVENADEARVAWFQTLLTMMVRQDKDEWRRLLMVLTPQEMASLWHIPHEEFLAEKITWASQSLPSELTGMKKDGAGDSRVCIGDTAIHGKATPVYLTLADREAHTFIAGKTKVGKSTLLHNLIHQDIQAGRGIAVIDPHGMLIDAIREKSIPKQRLKDVVLLECGRADLPVPLNPFRVPQNVSFASAADTLYWILRKIYADIWQEGRTDVVIRHLIEAILTDPQATPLDMGRLLTEDNYRLASIRRMEQHDEVSLETVRYWREFGKRGQGERREIADPIRNRQGALVGKRVLEYMTCHPNGLDFQAMISEKKIVLINLAGNDIRANAGYLGTIFLSGLYLAAESMGYQKGSEPRMHVYLDEAERFVATPLPDMLSQSRKFGLSLTLTSQYLKQLTADTAEGVFGNVGTYLLFEVGVMDLPTLKPLVQPERDADELLRLGLYRMMVKTRASGRDVPAFVATTRREPQAIGKAYERPDQMTQHGFLPKSAVQAWLMERYTTPEEPAPAPAPKQVAKPAANDVPAAPSEPKRRPAPKPKTEKPSTPKKTKDGGVTDFE